MKKKKKKKQSIPGSLIPEFEWHREYEFEGHCRASRDWGAQHKPRSLSSL